MIWSNALGYGGVSLGPREQLGELEDDRRAFRRRRTGADDRIPALRCAPFPARHGPEGASELRRRAGELERWLRPGKGRNKRTSIGSRCEILTSGRWSCVARRPRAAARALRLAWRGRYYDTGWGARRAGAIGHLALGTEVDPAGVPRCEDVLDLAERAGGGGELVAQARPSRPWRCRLAMPSAAASSFLPRPARPTSNPRGAGEFALEAVVPSSGLHGSGSAVRCAPRRECSSTGRRWARCASSSTHPATTSTSGRCRCEGRIASLVRIGGPDLHPGSAGSDGPLGPLVIAPQMKAMVFVAVAAGAGTEPLRQALGLGGGLPNALISLSNGFGEYRDTFGLVPERIPLPRRR